MLKKPFFSVIIPTLNEEQYLPELLNDLANQTYQNFEVIVVDGYSDDKTQEKAKQFSQKLPSLTVINSLKRNLPYQRNLGAKSSNGDYLIFFDADVQVPKNYLKEIVKALEIDRVDFMTTWLEGDDKSLKSEILMTATNLMIEVSKLIDKPFAVGGNAIISKTAFKSIGGYREDLTFHEDYDLSMRLNKAGYKLYVLKKPKLTMSLRRMRKQGTNKTIQKYAIYTMRFFLKGAPTSDSVNYDMGGHVYQKPKLSVIIPTFNEEICLPRLLRNISKQKLAPYEVIIVDGGSTDRTIELAKKFTNNFSLQIIATNLKNVSSQRNLGAKKATGNYFIFFDADVQINSRFFQRLQTEIEKHQPFFATTYVRADSNNFYDKVIATFVNVGADLSVFIEKPFAGGWNTIVERNAFWKINGFREDTKHAEDWDLSMKLNDAGFAMKVFKQPRVTYSLRRFRQEGRLKSIQKNAAAALHIFTKGPITKEIFSYPMGGGWYKIPKNKQKKDTFSQQARKFMVKFKKWIEE